MNPVLTTSCRAAAPIEPYRIVKFDVETVRQATAATDKLIGVSRKPGVNVGQHADIVRLGIAEVELGGAVTSGAEITSDAQGRGVALGATGESVGRADQSGVEGDIIPVYVRPLTK